MSGAGSLLHLSQHAIFKVHIFFFISTRGSHDQFPTTVLWLLFCFELEVDEFYLKKFSNDNLE
jgi:hypothetical protein